MLMTAILIYIIKGPISHANYLSCDFKLHKSSKVKPLQFQTDPAIHGRKILEIDCFPTRALISSYPNIRTKCCI